MTEGKATRLVEVLEKFIETVIDFRGSNVTNHEHLKRLEWKQTLIETLEDIDEAGQTSRED